MRYKGYLSDFALDEYDAEIKEAVLTEERVAIDWVEDGENYHLLAHSKDGGRTYDGTYGVSADGTPRLDPNLRVRLTRLLVFDDTPRLVAHWLADGGTVDVQSLFELADGAGS